MEAIYKKHRQNIIKLFHDDDIDFILIEPLKSNFDESAISRIRNERNERVKVFFEEFDEIKVPVKFMNFIEVTSEVSEWVAAFLISEDDGESARKKFTNSYQLINQNADFFISNLTFNPLVVKASLDNDLITSRTYSMLIAILKEEELFAKYRFHALLHVHSINCYSKFLFLCLEHCSVYLTIFYGDLSTMIEDCRNNEEIKACIEAVSSSEIDNYTYDVTVPESPQSTKSEVKTYDTDTSDSTDNDDNIDPDYDDFFGKYENKRSNDLLLYQPEISATDASSTLSMREYQNELATKGIEGKNVLICAPTSSGKTVVAIKIAEEHMKLKPTGKVAMVVPTTVLVDQQFNLFRKYLGKTYKINKLSGGTKSFTVPLSKQIKDNDIFVFTCDILRNSLEEKDEPLQSISEFTLIIFDECHHCDKDHSYNKVMDHYFKEQQEDRPVPQIIGMTASTGTDKANNVDAALKTLISRCANLDCHIVATVSIHTEELKKSIPDPMIGTISPGSRATDKFEDSLVLLMGLIESILYKIFKSKNKPISIPADRYHDKYLSFVKGITNYFPNLLSDEERKAVKMIEIYLENLYRALIVNHLFHRTHAIDMLKEKIDTKGPCICEVDTTLRRELQNFLSSAPSEQDTNPSLKCLKEEIDKQIKADKKSKIIIFVKEVNYTRILETEIQSAKLGFIECKALVGTNKSADQGGLSKSETEDIVARFRKGIINLIFATSVAEEGLDVEKCNLVIRYGHVTNEIAMVQSRGRARCASDSKYIVIVPEKMKWQVQKENTNKIRETMMYKAIERFQRMDLNDLKKQVFESQEKRRAHRYGASGSPLSTPKSVAPVAKAVDSFWDLHCIKCGAYLCSSDDIRSAKTSYIVINGVMYENMKMTRAQPNNYPVLCAHCQLPLGYVVKVDSVNVPTIKIANLVLKRGTDSPMKIKKWKDVPFKVPEVKSSELSDCNTGVFDPTNI